MPAEVSVAAVPWHREPWARFALAFGILVSLFEVLYHGVVLDSDAFGLFVRGLAHATAAVLDPFYERVSVLHARVATNKFVVTVDDGCDGLQVCTLLSAAVLAFPSTWSQKLVGIVAGNIWLQGWNVVRIATLVVVGGIEREWFHPTHVYIWPTLLIALCLATWMAWARWTMRDDEPHEPDQAGA
jgi:exosortase H (IPTLxxWG-CTERM-specific)